MKRFELYHYLTHKPTGGKHDYEASFDTFEEALAYLDTEIGKGYEEDRSSQTIEEYKEYHYFNYSAHIYDKETHKIVWEEGRDKLKVPANEENTNQNS